MTDVRAELKDHLHGMAAPFLFVGAGLSRRYVAADDWEGLLRRFAGFTSKPYDYYRSIAEGDLPTVASRLAEDFHEVWWSDNRFVDSRAEWSERVKGSASALKVEVARHLASAAESLPKRGTPAKELELLRGAVVDGIITTNFDPILESLFPDFRVFVGQDELLFSNPQGVGEIYKIHGSTKEPDSLVLTAEDYDLFDRRNAYLAAKLLTIFVEHPVVFLGYSLQDRNVVSILRSIAGCLTQANIAQLQDRLIFVEWERDAEPRIGPHTIMVDGFVIAVRRIVVPDFVDVFATLAGLQRTFPAKLLRRLKKHVYDLVLTDDPHSQLVVSDIEDDTHSDDLEVVFGVGVQARMGDHGYVGLGRWHLIDDVLAGGNEYECHRVLTETLPHLLAGNADLPVFKYLREGNALDKRGELKKTADADSHVVAMAAKVRAGLQVSPFYAKKAPTVLAKIRTIADLHASEGLDGVLNYGLHLKPSAALASELRDFLDGHREFRASGTTRSTQYVKLVCLYDWLRYGRLLGGE